ncbi:MAG: hypothetical protein ABR498_00065, partial [Candidatus Dormibacteria bacterium]
MKVFLLTSHPVAPPWNSGDANLARTLMLKSDGFDFVFVGDGHDPTPWPPHHQRLVISSADHMPSSIEKLRVLAQLAVRPPQSDVVHMIVTLQRSWLRPLVLQSLPLLRDRPWIATW